MALNLLHPGMAFLALNQNRRDFLVGRHPQGPMISASRAACMRIVSTTRPMESSLRMRWICLREAWLRPIREDDQASITMSKTA